MTDHRWYKSSSSFSRFTPLLGETCIDADECDESNEKYSASTLSLEDMARRKAFWQEIQTETCEHRRILPHGSGSSGRNVLLVLVDRERKSGAALTLRRGKCPECSDVKGHNRSPSTVFDSPVSTASPVLDPHPLAAFHDDDDDDDNNNNNDIDQTCAMEDRMEGFKKRVSSYPSTITRELCSFAEYTSATKYKPAFINHLGRYDELDEEGNRPASSSAVSTISIAFSPDSKTMASTHGDHTVKISCCNTGRLLQSLEGHPRTPWTVKYHPTDYRIVASGCLGHQVRVWNWEDKVCLQMTRLEFAIISLSFHPSGTLLAVANGTRLHFWGVDGIDHRSVTATATTPRSTSSTTATARQPQQQQQKRSDVLTEMNHRHMLRCVHFPPDGNTLIIGGVDDEARRRLARGALSFYLRLWDFDLETALRPPSDGYTGLSMARRSISNARTFVPRALFYNDGGFDVSPDGKMLCVCAEYWLPHGVDNAMDLLRREEFAYAEEMNKEFAGESKQQQQQQQLHGVEMAANGTLSVVMDPHASAMSANLITKLRGLAQGESPGTHNRFISSREGADHPVGNRLPSLPRTPTIQATDGPPPPLDFVPRTPPIPRELPVQLSPPSPPRRRYQEVMRSAGALPVPDSTTGEHESSSQAPPPPAANAITSRTPHPLSIVSSKVSITDTSNQNGRYVPHVVCISLDTTPIPEPFRHDLPRGKPFGAVAVGYRPRLGQLLEACPLDPAKASAITCVKFSPSADYCLIGYGVRETVIEGNYHPVTTVYRVRDGMTQVSTMLASDDDVNIARFHPDPGHGFVYGTKQGRVRILSPRPWNYYSP